MREQRHPGLLVAHMLSARTLSLVHSASRTLHLESCSASTRAFCKAQLLVLLHVAGLAAGGKIAKPIV